MLRPQQRLSRAQQATLTTVPAPIGGLNAHDSLASMPATDAVTLNNFFPTPTTVDLRKGFSVWATGLPAAAESLMAYRSATANTLFAASGTAFYNVTSAGAVGAPVVTALTNARFQHINIGTPGGQFLLAVNGADKLQGYDGTNWWKDGDGAHDITGFNTNVAISINIYKSRAFLIQKNSFIVWYLPVNAISGAAASIDMSPLFKLGGYLMAMITWTIDNSNGTNEYAVFLSSEGEMVMYNGTDPSVAANWVIQGTFRVGRPIGRRCYVKVGSDVIIISADGFFPLSKALLTDRSQEQDAISDKIVNLVSSDVQSYSGNFGWEACLYTIGNKLIINVPQREGVTQYQYVMNTITGAWCRFTNWNANCFAVMNDVLYFGGNLGSAANSGFIAKADTGYSDNGAYIFGEAKTAFQYFGAPGYQKHFKSIRPIIQTSGNVVLAMSIDVDFEDRLPASQPTFSGTSGTAWNTAAWNTFPWGDVTAIKKDWQTVTAIGDAGAYHMRVVNNMTALSWMATTYSYIVARDVAQ